MSERMAWQVVHQNAKNSTTCGRPVVPTNEGSLATKSFRSTAREPTGLALLPEAASATLPGCAVGMAVAAGAEAHAASARLTIPRMTTIKEERRMAVPIRSFYPH